MNKIKNFAVTLFFLAAACFLGYYLAENMPKNNYEADNSISQPMECKDFPYTIKAYEGKLAVFSGKNETPDIVFDVYLNQLPEYDRQQIINGIFVESYDKLISLIEDFTS